MTHQEYIALVDRAKQLNYEYYVLAAPTVTDAQFDALVSEIEQAEEEHPVWTLADSPTQQVGSDLQGNGRRLVRHRTRMLSCQKAQTQEAVTKWLTQTEKKLKGAQVYALEWKYDGISCSLVYQDGQLISAATRGDKDRGQDLLAHVGRIPSVPQRIGIDGRVEVRGEIVCPKSALPQLSYKDCRTAAAALTNQTVPTQEVERLVFLAWQMDFGAEESLSESNSMATAREQGFMANVTTCEAGDVLTMLDEYETRREALPYPTDGVVIKINGKATAASLGYTEHHPKGNIAYKFSAQKAVTRCIGIEICVGETGKRTPRALLEPVMIMGREVKAASMGSERVWHELGVTDGCLVEVGLSNDVTPKIFRVIKEGHTESTESTGNAGYTSPAESVSTETVTEPVQDASNIEPTNNQCFSEEEAPIEEPAEEQPVYNNTEFEQLQQENERLRLQLSQQQAQPRPRRQRKPRVEHQQPVVSVAVPQQPIDTNLLKALGMVAAATVALFVIYETGLLIPLGLIGLATGGILK